MADYRILEQQIITEDGKSYIFAAGTSNDTKPVGDFVNGSIALEVDTRAAYFYNEDISDWDDGSGNNG